MKFHRNAFSLYQQKNPFLDIKPIKSISKKHIWLTKLLKKTESLKHLFLFIQFLTLNI